MIVISADPAHDQHVPHPAEPALLAAHDGVSIALALLVEGGHPHVTTTELASLTLRLQMIASRFVSLADALTQLQTRAIHDVATRARPGMDDRVAAHTAKEYCIAAHDRLRKVPDLYSRARLFLEPADHLPVRPRPDTADHGPAGDAGSASGASS